MEATREELISAAADMVKNLTTGKDAIEYRAAIYKAADYYEITTSEVGKALAQRRKAKRDRPKHKSQE